ncbi:MAG: hypothetical protein ACKO0Z_18210 [Betaproteobacteria bacterium]
MEQIVKHLDSIAQLTATIGLGSYVLGTIADRCRAFSILGNGERTTYRCQFVDTADGLQWEVGEGVVGSGTLSRLRLIASSTGSFINWGAGDKEVFCVDSATRSTPYEHDFVVDDWVDDGDDGYAITVGASQHNKGDATSLRMRVLEIADGIEQDCSPGVALRRDESTGDVVLRIVLEDDLRFAGRLILL